MQWKTRKQERKKRKRRGLAKTLVAVTAVGSSLGLGSLINTETVSAETLKSQITNLEKEIKKEQEETKKAEKNLQEQQQVNIKEHTQKCTSIVAPPK